MVFLRCIRIDLTHLILLVHPVGPGSEWDRVPFVATSRVLGPYSERSHDGRQAVD
jgi:hypothetical protein